MGIAPRPGIVARVASHRYSEEVAHAKSFTVSAVNFHTSRLPGAVAFPAPRSSGPTITRWLSLSSACDKVGVDAKPKTKRP